MRARLSACIYESPVPDLATAFVAWARQKVQTEGKINIQLKIERVYEARNSQWWSLSAHGAGVETTFDADKSLGRGAEEWSYEP
jgi:hypothetical protein